MPPRKTQAEQPVSKSCTKCDATKPLADFYKGKSACKSCLAASDRERYLRDPEASRAKGRAVQARRSKQPGFADARRQYEKSPKGRYTAYKSDAKRYSRSFLFTLDQFTALTEQPCFYCSRFSSGKDYVGIDRKDSSIGYEPENCVPCCDACNYMKQTSSQAEFFGNAFAIQQQLFNRAVASVDLNREVTING